MLTQAAYILKPVDYEEFGSRIDDLKIALFQQHTETQPDQREERPIHAIIRYLREHLLEEVSLSMLAEEFHLTKKPLLGRWTRSIHDGVFFYKIDTFLCKIYLSGKQGRR